MKGIEIARKYFETYGLPMIKNDFGEIEGLLAVGLCGSGSECYGYDDEISRDHDFEPGFCIFVPEDIDRKVQFNLERAYSKLPKEFMGLKRNLVSPVGGSRHGVIPISKFFTEKTGTVDGQLSREDWFNVPEASLAEAVNGELFFDNLGQMTEIRNRLSQMPEDVRLKKLASHLLNMGQGGQYNYRRCIMRGENGAAQLAVFEFVKSALQTAFLLNKRYMPYYKWSFRALKDLPQLSELYDSLEFLISTDNTKKTAELKAELIENISVAIIENLKKQGITKATCTNLETHAYSVNDCIKDSDLRNRHILYAL